MFGTETEFVRWLQKRTSGTGARPKLGIGDDAALVGLRPGHELILTTDMSIEGVHFTSRWHPPHSVGHRALARALSDIAAMGGVPRYALVSLAVSRHATSSWIKGFYDGLLALAQAFKVSVIGGDTAKVTGPMTIDVIVAGEVRRGQALRRAGARPGDLLYVSGQLGLSALGLRLMKRKGDRYMKAIGITRRSKREPSALALVDARTALKAHLFPQPQCALGHYLACRRLATAAIDLSDGLSTDLHRLCAASGVGATVCAARLPCPALGDRRASLHMALHGGEDYQLLFTVDPRRVALLPTRFRGLPLHAIGEIPRARKVILLHTPSRQQTLSPGGYDHFRR